MQVRYTDNGLAYWFQLKDGKEIFGDLFDPTFLTTLQAERTKFKNYLSTL